MKKSNVMPALVLGCICIVVALMLSAVNLITGPIIAASQNAAANAALLEVLPNGTNFEEIEITAEYPSVVKAGYKADGGFVFQMEVAGYNPGLIIMCGINNDGKVVGVKHIQTNETFGFENELNGKYTDATIDTVELVLATGATPKSLSSKAYFDAVKAALQSAVLAAGGDVDTRTPEQILQDNLNAAAGTEGLVYTKWFALEALEGVDAVYEAADNSVRVYVIGEAFVCVKNGAVVGTDATEDAKATVLAADAVVGAITLDAVTKPEGAKATVKSIQKASNGTYVFEMSANGYQAMFDWGDGTPIIFKLAISADGKIIDVVTVTHKETPGLGDACATEDYYEQYRGKGDEDITISSKYPTHDGTDLIPSTSTDVGIIASATYTTVGYQTAVKDAFAAFQLLTATEGGNES